MKRGFLVKMCHHLIFIISLFLTLALTGCGDGTEIDGSITVTVNPGSVTLAPSETCSFTATVTNTDNTEVTWKVQEPDGGSITSDGDYTAPLNPGTYHVIATSKADPSKSGKATVWVTASGGPSSPIMDVECWEGVITVTCQNGQTTGYDPDMGTTYTYKVDTAGTINFTMYGPIWDGEERYSWSLKRNEPVTATNCHYQEQTKEDWGDGYNTLTIDCPSQNVNYSWPAYLDLDIRLTVNLNTNRYRLTFSDTPLKGDRWLRDEAGDLVDESHEDDEGYLPGADIDGLIIPAIVSPLSGSSQVKVPFGRGGELTLNVTWNLVKKIITP